MALHVRELAATDISVLSVSGALVDWLQRT
jgi:hypothetical protein